MEEHEILMELEDIWFKYERLESLVYILQAFVAESVEVVGAPVNSIQYALYEIVLEMREANKKLKEIIYQEDDTTGQ